MSFESLLTPFNCWCSETSFKHQIALSGCLWVFGDVFQALTNTLKLFAGVVLRQLTVPLTPSAYPGTLGFLHSSTQTGQPFLYFGL